MVKITLLANAEYVQGSAVPVLITMLYLADAEHVLRDSGAAEV